MMTDDIPDRRGGELLRGPGGTARWHLPAALAPDGERLLYRIWDEGGPGRRVNTRPELLESFVRLAQADPPRILAFAKGFGVLGLCEHGLPSYGLVSGGPSWHEPKCVLSMRACTQGSSSVEWFVESIAGWRHWAKQAGALVHVSNALHQGRLARRADWRAVIEWGTINDLWGGRTIQIDQQSGDVIGAPDPDAVLERIVLVGPQREAGILAWLQQEELNAWVNAWLRLGRVELSLHWTGDARIVALEGSGLFGSLAVHLLHRVWGSTRVALCRECDMLLPPGRHFYCDEHGSTQAARRRATRKYQRTEKGKATVGRYRARVAARADTNVDTNPRGGQQR
jgi:hypothetical protein